MKKLSIIFIFLFAVTIHAQSSVAGYIGVGRSAFDFDDFQMKPENQAGNVPIGIQITLGDGMLQFGADASFSAVPFAFEVEQSGNKVGEVQITQLFLGGFLRVNIGNEAIQPYAKAGGGAYMGKLKWEPEAAYKSFAPADEEDFKTAFGFYLAAGVDFKIGKTIAIFAEIPYHFVKRKLDLEDVDDDDNPSFTANNFSVNAGIRILFK